ncbi:MAG: carboxypeptidase-like regulatory domain-containing protein, partial [Bryobacteraceae bacterium]
MKLKRAILALWCCSAVLPAIDLSGRVASGGRPLPGAVVTAHAGGATQSTSTGEDGAFALQLAATGPVQIEVALFGFGPLKQTFSAEDAAKPLNLNLELVAPRTPGRAGAGAQAPDSMQSLNNQVTESLNTPITTPAPAAPENGETADSVLVQGSMQQAAPDVAGMPGGPGGFGPGMGGQGPGGAPGGGGG